MNRYNISKASALLGVSSQTLRNWDKNNTLKPSLVTENGYRYYTDDDLAVFLKKEFTFEKLNNIKVFRDTLYDYFGHSANVVIPNTVKSICEDCFECWPGLESITIPKSVESIGVGAFDTCENLTIYAPAGSYAEEYAESYSVPFTAK